MKKSKLSVMTLIVASTLFVACNSSISTEAKSVELKNEIDSINYAMGVSNGAGIRLNLMHGDSVENRAALRDMMWALNEAFQSGNKEAIYAVGQQVGLSLNQWRKEGLLGDSTLVLNVNLMKQGLINGFKSYDQPMSKEELQTYFQTAMQEIQMKKMQSIAPASIDTTTQK